MSKIKYVRDTASPQAIRDEVEFYYNQKFFNKWMGKYRFIGLNYQQQHYIMKKFWSDGTVACSRPVGIPNNLGIDLKEDSIIFTPWVMQDVYNIYDFPTKAMPINTRGVGFISTNALDIDKDIVIGYVQRNQKGIYSSIKSKIKQLVDLEMTIRTNTKTQKMPWLFVTTPENETVVKKMAEGIENDDSILFTTLDEVDKAHVLVSSAPYILDKLEQLRQKLENDILTFLGTNNVGVAEKKEHMVVDEVNANNQEIEESSNNFEDMIDDFLSRIDLVFGYKIILEKQEVENYGDEDSEQ